MRKVAKALLLLLLLGLGGLAWDVYQLRALRPPADRSFEGFERAGRRPASLRLDEAAGRLTWVAPPPRTLLPHAEPPLYVFDRAGRLLDWTPGVEPGMLSGAPLPRKGREVSLDRARAWLQGTKVTW